MLEGAAHGDAMDRALEAVGFQDARRSICQSFVGGGASYESEREEDGAKLPSQSPRSDR